MEWNEAIVGAVAGALLTAAGFIYKRRLENLSVLKKSLYQLLILYRSVNTATIVTPAVVAKWIVEVIHEVIPEAKGSESMEGAEALYSEVLSKIIDAVILPEEENLVPMYLGAIENISSIDPVLAYRLSGNAALKRYLVAADQETLRVREIAARELSPTDMELVKSIHSDASLEATREVIRELRSDLLLLSFKCGIFQFIGVARRVFARKQTAEQEKAKVKAAMKSFFVKAIESRRNET